MVKQRGFVCYQSYIYTIAICREKINKFVQCFTKMSHFYSYLPYPATYHVQIYLQIGVLIMQDILPFLFLIMTIVAFFMTILGIMQLIPLFIALPLLFISIYLTLFTFTHKRVFRGMR